MNNNLYFNNEIINYLITFLSLFIHINVKVKINNKDILYNVPVVVGNFSSYSVALKYLKDKGKNVLSSYDTFPIIAITLRKISFDKDRDIINKSNNIIYKSETENEYFKSRIPIPTNYTIDVTFWSLNYYIFGQMIEQTFPHFVRPFSIEMAEIEDTKDVTRSIQIELENPDIVINNKDENKMDSVDNYETFRNTFTFKIKGYMHFPIYNKLSWINKIEVESNIQNNKIDEMYKKEFIEKIDRYIDSIEQLKINYYNKYYDKVEDGFRSDGLHWLGGEVTGLTLNKE